MPRFLVIKNDEIVNTIVWDGITPISIDGEIVEAQPSLGTGDKKINNKWHRKNIDDQGNEEWVEIVVPTEVLEIKSAPKKKKK